MIERAHVVQAVGQLDQHDANVVRHRDDHLAEILGLLFLAALERDLRDLGHAVNQLRDLGAEVRLHLAPATCCVSSTTSCSRPVTIEGTSSLSCAMIIATFSGCVT